MHILLTGPNGFLGSALARHWSKLGHTLTLLARPTSSLNRLEDILQSMRVARPTTTGDIVAAVREASPDVIVHTACAYGRKGETLLNIIDSNLVLGSAMLQAISDNEIENNDPVVFLNTGTVLSPDVSLYALSKTQFSALGATIAERSPTKLRFIDVRLQQMYGIGDDSTKFTTQVIEACCRNLPRLALTPGEQLRDFVHIDDVVRAFDCILERRNEFAINDAIDVGSGEAITMRQFVELTKELSGASSALDFGTVAYRPNEAMHCEADTTRLKSLGWQKQVSLNDGLMHIIKTLQI